MRPGLNCAIWTPQFTSKFMSNTSASLLRGTCREDGSWTFSCKSMRLQKSRLLQACQLVKYLRPVGHLHWSLALIDICFAHGLWDNYFCDPFFQSQKQKETFMTIPSVFDIVLWQNYEKCSASNDSMIECEFLLCAEVPQPRPRGVSVSRSQCATLMLMHTVQCWFKEGLCSNAVFPDGCELSHCLICNSALRSTQGNCLTYVKR